MGRRKIEIKAIKDDRNRSVTFLKRKGGLFKKAHELSVLTSVDVAVIIFGQNNKLYEYSSTSNLPDFLQRYQYARNAYGGPHELKGPDDFKDKRDGDDDDDDDDVGDLHGSPSPPQAMMPQHAMPPHPQQFQGLGGTPSASPPMPNGGFHHHHPHHGTPQPISRPTSRAHMRHPSQGMPPNMPPGQHIHQAQQQPSYAYQPNPPIYNPQAAAAMQARSQPPPPQYPNYTSVPQSHQPQHQQQQPVPQHMYQQEPPRPVPASQIPTSQPQQQELKPPQIQVPSPEPPQNQFNSPPLPQPKPLPASKTHSIFTPIEDSRSVLLRHWGGTEQKSDPLKSDPNKSDLPRSQSLDVGSLKRNQMNGVIPNGKPAHAPTSIPPQPQRTSSTPTISSIPQIPPTRSNSLAKPKLKVQIPADDDADGNGEKGGETSSDNRNIANANNILTPIREPGLTPGPVLPPPSPSASALLSAGATGPPNPFARPLPPPTTNGNSSSSNGGGGSGANSTRELDTPISALPSRFMENGLLPSPSSFYPDWPFGGRDSSGGSNMLPSPLTFQTPVATHGPSFRDEDPGSSGKRKLEAQATEGAAQGKRIKT